MDKIFGVNETSRYVLVNLSRQKCSIRLLTITNKIEYSVHKLNFGFHCQPIQITKQNDEATKIRVEVINCINVKP
jgi:hypothetical protein